MTAAPTFAWLGQVFGWAAGVAILLLLAEGWWPRTPSRFSLRRRWLANALLYGTTLGITAALPSLSLIATTFVANERGWGLLNAFDAPLIPAIVLSVLAIDLADYGVHRLEHRAAWLWRIHRLHHSDPDVDVTTTFRFHPLEVLLRAAVHSLAALAIGMPPLAAAAYLVVSMFTSVLSHANVTLPGPFERALQWLVITPGMHRIHHSADRDESETNFAVCLSVWDRLFRSYRREPRSGHGGIVFGLESRTFEQATSCWSMIRDPFLPEYQASAFAENLVPESRTD